MLTRAEKQKRVIELYEQGMSYREIAKTLRMSLGSISFIVKRYTREQGETESIPIEEKEKSVLSETTQAFRLFEQANTPIEVAINLDLGAEDVNRIYREYCQLKGLHGLSQIYDEVRDKIPSFVKFYNDTKNAGIDSQRVVDALKIVEEIPLIETSFQILRNDVDILESRKERTENDLRNLSNQMAAATEAIRHTQQVLINLNYNKLQLEGFISRLKTNNEEYHRVVRIAREMVSQILNNKRVLLHAALGSVLEALKEDPDKQLLIYDSLDDPLYTIPSIRRGIESKDYIELCKEKLLQIIEEVYDKLLNKCVNIIISSAAAAIPSTQQ